MGKNNNPDIFRSFGLTMPHADEVESRDLHLEKMLSRFADRIAGEAIHAREEDDIREDLVTFFKRRGVY